MRRYKGRYKHRRVMRKGKKFRRKQNRMAKSQLARGRYF